MKNKIIAVFFIGLIFISITRAQFIDNFDSKEIVRDSTRMNGWNFLTGEGTAKMDFTESGEGFATINIDATKDKLSIWWAIIKRCVSKNFDLSMLKKSDYAIRVESRIRIYNAPKSINLSLNTQRTKNFHNDFMEFDIHVNSKWHTVSLTLPHFDAVPGDTIYAQLALMDWCLKKYQVDVDYFKVDIVNIDSALPDIGVQVPYHPPIENVETFTDHLPV
jgi:hypothetical protein